MTFRTKLKNIRLITIFVILVASISLAQIAHSQFVTAQSSQSTYTANLTYLTVQVTYPSQVMPGDSVTVSLQATARKSIDSVSLAAQVYYSDGSSLHQLASGTMSGNSMNVGNSFSKQLQFTIPQDTPRTSLVAVLTENVKTS